MGPELKKSLWHWTVVVLLLCETLGCASVHVKSLDDTEVVGVVVGRGDAATVERILGSSSCQFKDDSGKIVSFFYRFNSSDDGAFLRIEVGDQVDAITLSMEPPVTGYCYAPLGPNKQPRTGKGLQLGDDESTVIQLYGRPMQRFEVGPFTRFRHQSVRDRVYEWDLLFRHGHLLEWTVSTEG
jgi:hypothetical protein